jgi:hypothetical protein
MTFLRMKQPYYLPGELSKEELGLMVKKFQSFPFVLFKLVTLA